MNAGPLSRISRYLEPVGTSVSGEYDVDHLKKMLQRLPWAVFIFLYVPLLYWSGFALKATRVLDYPSFYLASRLALVDGISPYGYGALDDYSIVLDRWLPPYVYPPPSLLTFWPLTAVSIERGFIIFTVISHLCLIGSMWLILTRLIPLPKQPALRAIVFCASVTYILFSDAVPVTLNLGQINIITLFFICLSFTALQQGKSAWHTAWPLSIAILLKTYPILLLILLFVRRRFRALALTVACYATFVAVALVAVPKAVWTSWRTEVLPAAVVSRDEVRLFSHSNVSFVWNQSITGFFTRLFGDRVQTQAPFYHPSLVAPVAHLVVAIVILLTALAGYGVWRRGIRLKASYDDLAAFLLMVYLVAPVSWDHHLVFILPPAVLTLALILNGSVRGKTSMGLALALCILAWRMNLEAPLFQKRGWTMLASLKFVAVSSLWLFFLNRLYRAGFGAGSSSSSIPVVEQGEVYPLASPLAE